MTKWVASLVGLGMVRTMSKAQWEEDNKPMRKPSSVIWVVHTAFGKTKLVPVSVHNADLGTPNPKVHWIERDEDLYGLPKNQTAYILRAEDFRRADIHAQ